MASIKDVAKLAKPALGGIDWAALAKKPRDESGTPGDSIWHTKQHYYFDYMRPAGLKAMKVVDTLDIDVNSDEAFSHFKNLHASVKTVTNIAWESALEGADFVLGGDKNEMKVTVETLRASVAICWYTALFAAEVHRTAAMQQAWRKFSDEDIVEHAVLTTAMFECITALDSWGLLKSIKKGASAGTGAIPAAVLLGIGLVIAIAVIAFMVISIMDVSSKNRALAQECTKAREAGDDLLYDKCINALTNPKSSIATELFRQAAQTATPWVVGGGMLILGVAFLPTVVRKLKGGVRAARE